MLIPLTRKTLDRLIPIVATGDQYRYCWGQPSDLLKRLLVSVVAVIIVLVVTGILGAGVGFLRFILGITAGLYWFWYPVYVASFRNAAYRRYPYGGFWQGEILDVYVTEELVGEEETVNRRGELVIVENRERRLNLEVADEGGFQLYLQVPLQREHKAINPGQRIQLVMLSKDRRLTRFSKLTDAYIPSRDIWVSDYPYLERETFVDVSYRIQEWREPPVRRRSQRSYRGQNRR